ncbi:alpha/beta hydrolase [Flavisphingomonas formosensis]|uniref:alpha/beta hydrolase n=1 Tax=Flavisphingomonas formosensis TaxID=861534 RepID=UPI0012FB718F|nr:alpha/beta hydrolase [Sphingomonas formosensis]
MSRDASWRFDETDLDDDLLKIHADARARLAQIPPWKPEAARRIREARSQGGGVYLSVDHSPRARVIEVPGPGGPIALRIIAPAKPKGVYLHFHGGGWFMGGADLQDPRLEAIADRAQLACVSVEYRLTPEHPYPAAPDDCEAAALWLLTNAKIMFGTEIVTIGGESSGAHLSVVTLLRLRDKHNIVLYGANLVFGFFDLTLTPSARMFGDERIAPRTTDLRSYARAFAGDADLAGPEISPMYANLDGLCPALFTIGTQDPLLDDSLFMHMRWLASRNRSDLAVYPGGIHNFVGFPSGIARAAEDRSIAFLRDVTGQ